jgi:hypothetical protein
VHLLDEGNIPGGGFHVERIRKKEKHEHCAPDLGNQGKSLKLIGVRTLV